MLESILLELLRVVEKARDRLMSVEPMMGAMQRVISKSRKNIERVAV